MINYQEIFSQRLGYALEKRDVCIKELSMRTGIRQKTIYGYLVGGAAPRYDCLIAIAKALHLSLDWLCGMRVKEDGNA